MSKKREREINSEDGDAENGGGGAVESPLFEIAPAPGSSVKPSSKRSKTISVSNTPQHSQESVGCPNENEAAAAATAAATAARPMGTYHPAAIAPSSALRQCDGLDVVRKGARGRGRQLMVLPGALGLGNGGSGGKLGTLDMNKSANPVLYVEFPEGRLKCTGRTVHTKGRFFSLYGNKVGGRATHVDCRDVFDSAVFFSEACWVGKKEDNPSEEPLQLPDQLQSLKEEDGEASGSIGSGSGGAKVASAEFKTHFGGGDPACLMSRAGSAGSKVSGAVEEETEDGGGSGGGGEGNEESKGRGKAPARRTSSRSTKSTASYVEDDDDDVADGSSGGSSSGGGDEDDRGDGEEVKDRAAGRAEGDEDVVVVDGISGGGRRTNNGGSGEGGGGSGGGSSGGSGARDGVEIFSILNAPTAKRRPVTIGSGKEKQKAAAAAAAKNKQAGGCSSTRRKGRRRSLVDSSSSSDEGENPGSGIRDNEREDSGEESLASENDAAAAAATPAPSRRSSRSSAVSRVKYTQSSGSEDDEGEMEDDDEEEEDEFEP